MLYVKNKLMMQLLDFYFNSRKENFMLVFYILTKVVSCTPWQDFNKNPLTFGLNFVMGDEMKRS